MSPEAFEIVIYILAATGATVIVAAAIWIAACLAQRTVRWVYNKCEEWRVVK